MNTMTAMTALDILVLALLALCSICTALGISILIVNIWHILHWFTGVFTRTRPKQNGRA